MRNTTTYTKTAVLMSAAALLLMAAASSCQDKAAVETPNIGTAEITFNVSDGSVTKASESGLSDLQKNGFTLAAYNTAAGSSLLSPCTVTYDSGSSSFKKTISWPSGTVATFYGCYPGTLVLSGSAYVKELGSSSAPYDGLTDLVTAATSGVTMTSSSTTVPLSFGHPLAYLGGAKVKLVDAPSGWSVKVSALEVTAPKYGTFNIGAGTWNASSATQNLEFYRGAAVTATTSYQNISGTGRMLIPSSLDSQGKAAFALVLEYAVYDNNGAKVSDHTGSAATSLSVKLTPGKRATVALDVPVDNGKVKVSSVDLADWNSIDDRYISL